MTDLDLARRHLGSGAVALSSSPPADALSVERRREPRATVATKENDMTTITAHEQQDIDRANAAVTEITELPNRGHSLTIDRGW